MESPAPAPSGEKKFPLKTVIIVMAVLALLSLGTFASLLFLFYSKEVPLDPGDRAILVTAADLAALMDDFTPRRDREKAKKLRYLDGSWELEYEYDDTANDDAPYIYCVLNVEITRRDARAAYTLGKLAEKGAMELSSGKTLVVESRNDLFRWGDSSEFAMIQSEGRPAGNMFYTIKGTKVYSLRVTGVYFDDRESIEELLGPKLKWLESYRPKR